MYSTCEIPRRFRLTQPVFKLFLDVVRVVMGSTMDKVLDKNSLRSMATTDVVEEKLLKR